MQPDRVTKGANRLTIFPMAISMTHAIISIPTLAFSSWNRGLGCILAAGGAFLPSRVLRALETGERMRESAGTRVIARGRDVVRLRRCRPYQQEEGDAGHEFFDRHHAWKV